MIKTLNFIFLLIFLIITACGKSKRPGLSDSELFAQKETADTVRQTSKDSITEDYVVPPGIKYAESRAIDLANPPVVLDIANRKLNIRKFNLSDYYTKVRYIKIKHPMPPAEGNFLFDVDYYVTMKQGAMSGSGLSSRFSFKKDSIIAGDVFFGYYSYDNEGNFLHTIKTYDFPKTYDASQNKISYNQDDYIRAVSEGSTRKNNNRIKVDDKTMASYVYNPFDTLKRFLFTFDIKGDTLCRFQNYNFVPEMKKNAYVAPPSPNIYYYNGQLTVNQSLNDTVYRVVSPNRLIPAYVLNYGPYRLDVQTAFYGDQSQKLRLNTWREDKQYILFTYTQNYDCLNNRRNGSVKFFYAYYDKKSRQLYHFSEGTTIPKEEFFIENSVPDALPFILSYSEISDNQLRVYYSKKRLEEIIKNKGFASLSPEQQSKIKTMQNDLGESEVLIMILE